MSDIDITRPSPLAEQIWDRTRWRVDRKLQLDSPIDDDGRFATFAPLVQGSAFLIAAGLVHAPDRLLHLLFGHFHFGSWFALQAGHIAARSDVVAKWSARVDARLLPVFGPVITWAYRMLQKPLMAPVRGAAKSAPTAWMRMRFHLANGPGRAAIGAASMLVGAVLLSFITTVRLATALTLATINGAFRWGFPPVDERFGIVDWVEGKVAKLRPRAVALTTKGAGMLDDVVLRVLPKRHPGWNIAGRVHKWLHVPAPESVDDALTYAQHERTGRRRITAREARQLTAQVAGPEPARLHADRWRWWSLAHLLRHATRGKLGKVQLLEGEKIPEKIADRLAAWTRAARKRGESAPSFDLSSFGDATARYSSATEAVERESADRFDPIRPAATSDVRVPVGSRPDILAARALADRVAGKPIDGEERQVIRSVTALLMRATSTGEGLKLDASAQGLMARELCRLAALRQVETVDISAWEPATATALQAAVAQASADRRNPEAEQQAVLASAVKTLKVEEKAELHREMRHHKEGREPRLERLRRRNPWVQDNKGFVSQPPLGHTRDNPVSPENLAAAHRAERIRQAAASTPDNGSRLAPALPTVPFRSGAWSPARQDATTSSTQK